MGVRRWEVGSRDIIELMRDPNAKHVIREGSRQHPHTTLFCIYFDMGGGGWNWGGGMWEVCNSG